MKMIIDKKRYDTSSAQEIAAHWNGCSRSDFRFLNETLYRTKNDAWFLHGAGGALTEYASVSADGRNRYYSETIIPLNDDQTADWLAKHHPNLFEEYFSHLATDA